MFNYLSEKFSKVFAKLKRKTKLTESDLKEVLREVKFLLLESDVSLKVIKSFLSEIEEQIRQENLLEKLNIDKELLLIFKQGITKILGEAKKDLHFRIFPKVIFLIGLQGVGKTTSAAKLALFLKKIKVTKKPLLVSLDTYRPAAIEQLNTLAKQINVDFFKIENPKNPFEIAEKAKNFAWENNFDLIIYDTSGRQINSENLMDELIKLKELLKPEKIIQVIDAVSGQEILKTVETFNNLLSLSGFIATKLDSDAKGGAILSVTYSTKLPIFFIGEGEKLSNLNYFYPDRIANRILDLGDIQTLIDHANQKVDKKALEGLGHKLFGGSFDLNDLLEVLKQVNKLGKIANIVKMLPGLNQKISASQLDIGQKRMEIFKILISSMTEKERKNPKLLKNQSRKKRIIEGSGRTAQEFNTLINSFEMTLKKLKSANPKDLLKFNFNS